MKKTILILFMFFLTSPLFGQSKPKYENLSQCVLQTMKEMKLTGNKMFEMVEEECKRNQGSYKKEVGKTKNESFEVNSPKGISTYKVISVEY